MTTLKQLLSGYKLGEPQSAGIMRIVPILTDTEFSAVSDMENIYVNQDVAYDTLEMTNDINAIGVVPHGLMYVISEQAQDRTIPSAHLLKGKRKVNANCLQPSQGGYMSGGQKDREWGLLPQGLKITAWEHSKEKKYSALWDDMRQFLENVGLSGRELIQFFREFKDDLENFVAQFEPVKKQVGAIFIINNVLAGIEVVPNYKIWKQIWRPMVRDCYGSEAVAITKKGHTGNIYRPILKTSNVETINDLVNEVDRVKEEHRESCLNIFNQVIEDNLEQEQREYLENFTLYDIVSDKIKGQTVLHGPERMIYLSLVPRGATQSSEPRPEFDSLWNDNSPYDQDQPFNS